MRAKAQKWCLGCIVWCLEYHGRRIRLSRSSKKLSLMVSGGSTSWSTCFHGCFQATDIQSTI